MNALWIHRSMEQLQHLIVRRSCNGIARQEVIASWMAIQREVAVAIDEMDKELDTKLDTKVKNKFEDFRNKLIELEEADANTQKDIKLMLYNNRHLTMKNRKKDLLMLK